MLVTLLKDSHNIEKKAYCGLNCITNTKLYRDRKASDIAFAKKAMSNVSALKLCYSLTDGIVDSDGFNQLIRPKLLNMQTVIRLVMFSGRLELDPKIPGELESPKGINQKAR